MEMVSICIPCYQNEAGTRRLLESIGKQTYRQIEIVMTDDSIGREIENLAAEFSDRLPIRYRRNIKRLGAAANWNEAVATASAESSYIKLMHHDDWFTFPDSLEKMAALFQEDRDAQMVFCGTRQVPEGAAPYDRCTSKEDVQAFRADFRNLFAVGNTIGAPSAVMVRKTEDMPAYDERLKWLVDMDYYMSVLKDHPRFVYTEEPLVSIGMSEDQLTNACVDDEELQISEYTYVYRKYGLGDEACKRRMARAIIQNNGSAKLAGELGIPAQYMRQELRKKRKKQLESYLYAIKKRTYFSGECHKL